METLCLERKCKDTLHIMKTTVRQTLNQPFILRMWNLQKSAICVQSHVSHIIYFTSLPMQTRYTHKHCQKQE